MLCTFVPQLKPNVRINFYWIWHGCAKVCQTAHAVCWFALLFKATLSHQQLCPSRRFYYTTFLLDTSFEPVFILNLVSDYIFSFFISNRMRRQTSLVFIFITSFLCPTQMYWTPPIFCVYLKQKYKIIYFSLLLKGVAFGIELFYERHQYCEFRFKTNENLGIMNN